MLHTIGPQVLKGKANKSLACEKLYGHPVLMSETRNASLFQKKFMARVKQARERTGWTQEQMAIRLGTTQGNYKQYESRSYMPHELIPQFCAACNITIEWLFTGHQERKQTHTPIPFRPRASS